MSLFLRADKFVSEVDKLEPRWTSGSALDVLSLFEEAGLMTPAYRVVLPRKYAHYTWSVDGGPSARVFSKSEAAFLERAEQATWWVSPEDDAQPRPDHELPPDLARLVRRPKRNERLCWRRWNVKVAEDERGRPLRRPIAFSFYAEWQRYRFWSLLESYSIIGLLNPRRADADAVFGQRDPRLWTKTIWRTRGDSRYLALVEKLENEQWLRTLYRVREVIGYGNMAVSAPVLVKWEAGATMSAEERANVMNEWVSARCKELSGRWQEHRDDFHSQLRLLLDLWHSASEDHHKTLADAISADVDGATDWAAWLYQMTFEELNAAAGAGAFGRDQTLAHVLRPTWREARTVTERHLPLWLDSINAAIQVVTFTPDDVKGFLAFLDDEELWVWSLEFAQLVKELQTPTDTSYDRRFSHLRSLAILLEQLIVALVDRHGTPADRKRLGAGGTQPPLAAFLARRKGWRSRLWKCVGNDENWKLTQTTKKPLQVQLTRLADTKQLLCRDSDIEPAARLILTHAAVRNFGSHRFSRDATLLTQYLGQMLRATVGCALLYWKIASDSNA